MARQPHYLFMDGSSPVGNQSINQDKGGGGGHVDGGQSLGAAKSLFVQLRIDPGRWAAGIRSN